jgi:hypothetical protein
MTQRSLQHEIYIIFSTMTPFVADFVLIFRAFAGIIYVLCGNDMPIFLILGDQEVKS